jgi:hypothetical protein
VTFTMRRWLRFAFTNPSLAGIAALLDKYKAEDLYTGSLVGVQYAEAFRSRSPLLVDDPEVFLKTRFG